MTDDGRVSVVRNSSGHGPARIIVMGLRDPDTDLTPDDYAEGGRLLAQSQGYTMIGGYEFEQQGETITITFTEKEQP